MAATTTPAKSTTKIVVTATTGNHPVVTYMPSQDPKYTTVTETTTATNSLGQLFVILPFGIVWALVGGAAGGGGGVPPPPPVDVYPDTSEDPDGDGDNDNRGCTSFSMSECTKTVSYTSKSTGWSVITPGVDACALPTKSCVLPFGETTTTAEASLGPWAAATGTPGATGVIPKPSIEVNQEWVDRMHNMFKQLKIQKGFGIPDPDCQESRLYAPQREGDGSPNVYDTFEKWCKDMAGTKVVKAPDGVDTVFDRFDFRDYSFWLSANSWYSSPYECGHESTIEEHECIDTFNDAMIFCDPNSGGTHGAAKGGRCLQYNITLSRSTDDQSPPWNPLPEPNCEGSSSGVSYAFFQALSEVFCDAVDENTDESLSRVLTNDDLRSENLAATAARGNELRKRTPPASPNSYEGYKFHFDWTARDGGGCRENCKRAFEDMVSFCGNTGAMINDMTDRATQDVGCGAYSYSVEKPPPKPEPTYTTIPAVNPTAPAHCYLQRSECTNYDVDPDVAHDKSDTFCDDHEDYAGSLNWEGIIDKSTDVAQHIGWWWKVEWKTDCKDPTRTFLNLGDPIRSFSCKDAMRMAFDGCTDNGGRGGVVEVGCMIYYFSPVDRPDLNHVADSCLDAFGPYE
ncbi:hypothetical protein GGR57DRAFT_512050 [Xylariaceae sp. FL1272]|nr:hypothetical protein GGR57DRAFT_512050 [Xylariaceae sp. FL1272]